MQNSIALFLEASSNTYMQYVHAEAEREARHRGLRVETFYADNRFLQVQQIYSVINDERKRPRAIAVLPIAMEGFGRIARAALSRGMDWICVHRGLDGLDVLRGEYPTNAITLVAPDQLEIGRQQGRLARSVASTRRVLYVQGTRETPSAPLRLAGFREVVGGSCDIIGTIDGHWTTAAAHEATQRWLRIMAPSLGGLDVVVCQNDTMAIGVMQALAAQAGVGRLELTRVPIIGCDGAPDVGRRLVDEGRLAATVVLEGIGPAIVQVAANRLQGLLPPEQILLPPVPYGGRALVPAPTVRERPLATLTPLSA
jgi:ABC-type sugar transport system substrate-binding protein